MYKIPRIKRSNIKSVETYEGETIEQKIERIVNNKEAITDGAPEIYTTRKDGVIPAYDIRSDRWELAADAMDSITKSVEAKREEKAKLEIVGKEKKEAKTEVKVETIKNNEVKPIQGKEGGS